jgi:hypothetical protein
MDWEAGPSYRYRKNVNYSVIISSKRVMKALSMYVLHSYV